MTLEPAASRPGFLVCVVFVIERDGGLLLVASYPIAAETRRVLMDRARREPVTGALWEERS